MTMHGPSSWTSLGASGEALSLGDLLVSAQPTSVSRFPRQPARRLFTRIHQTQALAPVPTRRTLKARGQKKKKKHQKICPFHCCHHLVIRSMTESNTLRSLLGTTEQGLLCTSSSCWTARWTLRGATVGDNQVMVPSRRTTRLKRLNTPSNRPSKQNFLSLRPQEVECSPSFSGLNLHQGDSEFAVSLVTISGATKIWVGIECNVLAETEQASQAQNGGLLGTINTNTTYCPALTPLGRLALIQESPPRAMATRPSRQDDLLCPTEVGRRQERTKQRSSTGRKTRPPHLMLDNLSLLFSPCSGACSQLLGSPDSQSRVKVTRHASYHVGTSNTYSRTYPGTMPPSSHSIVLSTYSPRQPRRTYSIGTNWAGQGCA
ncbi:hypothetical protein IWZ01DRAFT_230580 [Phyllosticta capitalensis]